MVNQVNFRIEKFERDMSRWQFMDS